MVPPEFLERKMVSATHSIVMVKPGCDQTTNQIHASEGFGIVSGLVVVVAFSYFIIKIVRSL